MARRCGNRRKWQWEPRMFLIWRCSLCGFPVSSNTSRKYNLKFEDDKAPCVLCKMTALKTACILEASSSRKMLKEIASARKSVFKQLVTKLKEEKIYSKKNIEYALSKIYVVKRSEERNIRFDNMYCVLIVKNKKISFIVVPHCMVNEALNQIDEDTFKIVKEIDMARTKMVQVRMPVDLYHWLKSYCKKHSTTTTSILLDYLRYIESIEKDTIKVEQI